MKQQVKKYAKVWLAVFLTLAIVLQGFAGLKFDSEATETGFRELRFGDLEAAGTSDTASIYRLPASSNLTDLDGVAFTFKVNFNGSAGKLRIGGKDSLKHAGFSFCSSQNRLAIINEGIGSGSTVILPATEWPSLMNQTFTLRVTFSKDATTSAWTLKTYINGDLKNTKTFTDATPGIYLANYGVTISDVYTEMTFADWGINAGTSGGYDIYSLTNSGAINSLDGVAISGMVNFNGDTANHIRFGGTESVKHTGISLMTDSGRLILWAQGINVEGVTSEPAGVVMSADEWAPYMNQELSLNIKFIKNAFSDTWNVTVELKDIVTKTISLPSIKPGIYIANKGVTAAGLGSYVKTYTEMTFADWATKESSSDPDYEVYSLTEPGKITSLDGVDVTGKVNFNGDTLSRIRIGGTETTKHAGFSLMTLENNLVLWAQGLGNDSANNIVLDAEAWAALIEKEFTLRLVFDETATSEWSIQIYINNEFVKTCTYSSVIPGCYLAIRGMTIEGINKVEEAPTYTEMRFSDWSVHSAQTTNFNTYKLVASSEIISLDGVAVSGMINFNDADWSYIAIGGTSSAEAGGFQLRLRGTRWQLRTSGIGSSEEYTDLTPSITSTKVNTLVELRMTFDQEEGTDNWTVNVYADGVLVGTVTYEGAQPGTYFAIHKKVTVYHMQSLPDKGVYKEVLFSDWGKHVAETSDYDMYRLTDSSMMESLDGVAVSGKVNFNGAAWAPIAIGGTLEQQSDGFRVANTGSSLGCHTSLNGKSFDWTGLTGTSEMINQDVVLRVTFNHDVEAETDSWTMTVYANGTEVGSAIFAGITPGLYLAIHKSVTVDMSQPTEMEFGDWGIREGQLHGFDIYSLTDKEAITSLDKVAVSGTVNFNGNTEAYFRVGGFKTKDSDGRHTGIRFGQNNQGQFVLWPEAIGGKDEAQVILDAEKWANLINTEFTMRLEFYKDAATAEWAVLICINDEWKGTYEVGAIAPGLYMASFGESVVEKLGGPDIYNPPTEMGGETLTGNYITNKATQGNTEVIYGSDTDNDYKNNVDYSDYGLDYVLDFGVDRDIKVLQLSDTQTINSAQPRASRLNAWEIEPWAPKEMYNNLFRYIIKTVRDADPDLILIAGDLVYGEFDDDGTSLIALINCMDSLQIPWAPVFGNHENDSHMGVRWQCEQFEKSPYCLFNRRNEIGGNSNYSIGLAKNGELDRVIYMMDNNGCYNSSKYNDNYKNDGSVVSGEVKTNYGFTVAQKEWYQNLATKVSEVAVEKGLIASGEKIPSFMCYHAGTKDVYDGLVAAGYPSGSTDTFTIGVDVEAKNPGDNGSKGSGGKGYEYEEVGLREIMKTVGTDGSFFGHSHQHNFSIAYDGIRWTYGLKTGTYDTNPAEVGGTLITLASDSNEFTVTQIKTASHQDNAVAEIDDLYPRWDFVLPEVPENPNYIFWDKGVNNTGYKVPENATEATINDVACNAGDVHTTLGDWMLKYVEDGLKMIKRLVVFVKGDANCDDSLGAKDLVRMKNQTKETDAVVPADDVAFKSSDCDGNGKITDADTKALRDLLVTF